MKKTSLYDKSMNFFQKLVFGLEKQKFKIADHFPSLYDKIEKSKEKQLNKRLKLAKTEEEKEYLINQYKNELILLRTEKNRKENINYHFDKDYPEKTLYYLNLNKKIHKRGIIKNGVVISAAIVTSLISNSMPIDIIAYIFMAGETISLLKNIPCVMIQNYNIKRVQKYIDGPYQKYKKRLEKKALKYKEVTHIVSNTINESEKLPSVDEIIASLKTKEQCDLFLELVQKEIAERETIEKRLQNSKQKALKIKAS